MVRNRFIFIGCGGLGANIAVQLAYALRGVQAIEFHLYDSDYADDKFRRRVPFPIPESVLAVRPPKVSVLRVMIYTVNRDITVFTHPERFVRKHVSPYMNGVAIITADSMEARELSHKLENADYVVLQFGLNKGRLTVFKHIPDDVIADDPEEFARHLNRGTTYDDMPEPMDYVIAAGEAVKIILEEAGFRNFTVNRW